MLLILNGNSENGAQVRNNLCYLIRLRHLIRAREKTIFLHACARCSELPSNISTMIGIYIFVERSSDLVGFWVLSEVVVRGRAHRESLLNIHL